jgi:hypothetical protein
VDLVTGHDRMSGAELVKRYYRACSKPRKELASFRRSGQSPCLGRLNASAGGWWTSSSQSPADPRKRETRRSHVRLRQRVTKGPGSRAAGVAMARKLIGSAQARLRAVNPPHLVALVRADARFKNGKLVERPDRSEVKLKCRDTLIHTC